MSGRETPRRIVARHLRQIDLDFESASRPMVKKFMDDRFGAKQIASVGTWTTLKPKGIIKDLDRQLDNDTQLANMITSIIKDAESVEDIFRIASYEPKLKEYIKGNSDIFYMMDDMLGQHKSKSIHACAVIIFPTIMEAFEYVPVRKMGDLTVTCWGGSALDEAGFLKSDVLGVVQLDKYKAILNLIEENGKTKPDIYNLPLDDNEVFRYFGNGWNGDVFQFGTDLISSFTKKLKPRSLEDLIATNALMRPGTMENGYHNTYSACKNEGRNPEFLFNTEEITKNTHGLLVYQEQIMETCVKVGGMTDNEADDIRRAMGKKNAKYLAMWEDKLREGYRQKGATDAEFDESWAVMMEFAKYSFNKSHSAAYSIEGYICMFLKVHFPLEFWTVALARASEKETIVYLSEIHASKGMEVRPPDVNASNITMRSDNETNTIYWGIQSIKGIGEATAQQIISIRRLKGDYESLEDFLKKHTFKGSKVKKQTYESLIACGAFDKLYGCEGKEEERMTLIKLFREINKVKVAKPERDIYTIGETHERYWWKMIQKRMTGISFMNYKGLCEENEIHMPYATGGDLSIPKKWGEPKAFGGYVVECKVRSSKRGRFASLTIESNYKMYTVTMWSDEYELFKSELKGIEKCFLLFTGELKYNDRYGQCNQFTLKKEYSEFKVLR